MNTSYWLAHPNRKSRWVAKSGLILVGITFATPPPVLSVPESLVQNVLQLKAEKKGELYKSAATKKHFAARSH